MFKCHAPDCSKPATVFAFCEKHQHLVDFEKLPKSTSNSLLPPEVKSVEEFVYAVTNAEVSYAKAIEELNQRDITIRNAALEKAAEVVWNAKVPCFSDSDFQLNIALQELHKTILNLKQKI